LLYLTNIFFNINCITIYVCCQLDDILDASLVGDDELVLAGMDENDATKFHAARFRTAKKRREEKLKEEIEEKHRKKQEELSPNKTLLLLTSTSTSSSPTQGISNALVEVDEEEGEEEEEGGENVGYYSEDAPPPQQQQQQQFQPEIRREGVNGHESYYERPHHDDHLEDDKSETALEDVDMLTFLAQIFTPSEASTYAAILSSLGVDSPKELATVTQDMLVAAGIKKFHARKIGSAEIYRAFL
jgi:hypothetical protein